jgi:hypothetical protein
MYVCVHLEYVNKIGSCVHTCTTTVLLDIFYTNIYIVYVSSKIKIRHYQKNGEKEQNRNFG